MSLLKKTGHKMLFKNPINLMTEPNDLGKEKNTSRIIPAANKFDSDESLFIVPWQQINKSHRL